MVVHDICSRDAQVSQMEVTPESHSTPIHATWQQKDPQLPVLGILHLYLPAASSTVSIFILFRPPGSHVIKLKGPGGSSLAYALAGGASALTASGKVPRLAPHLWPTVPCSWFSIWLCHFLLYL